MINHTNISTIYISQKSGKPYYSGFKPIADENGNGPVSAIADALKKVFELRVYGLNQPITICFVDDEYYLTEPIELDVNKILKRYQDNNVLTDIWFDSMPQKTTKLIGGIKITDFKKDIFNGRKCLSAYIKEVKEDGIRFTDLYVNGKRASLTRYPKKGTLRCIDTENNSGELFTHSKWFIAKREDLNNLTNIEDAIVSYYHYWVDEHSPIESYDRDSGKLTMKYKSRFLISADYEKENCTSNLEYYIENIPDLFEEPDEWYLETKTGMLYYIPTDDSITAENITAFAPTLSSIINLKGSENETVKNIRFRNIEFTCTKGDYASTELSYSEYAEESDKFGSDCQSVAAAYGAINIEFSENCSFENCKFANLGVHGISIDAGCNGIIIDSCKFYDLGAGGIKIFGSPYGTEKIYHTHHNYIRNCDISYCGRRYAAGCGILICHSYNNQITDNTISYLDYSGISVGWVWGYQNSISHDNIIKGNDIHHIGMGNLSDMGGIYLLGRQRGTIVSNNRIHDVICKHYGGWGIYTDEGSSFMTIENNIVYNCSSNCYHQHYGSCNVIRNNIFAHSGDTLIRCSIPELHTSLIFENNIMVTDGQDIFCVFEDKVNGYAPGIGSHNNFIFDTKNNEPNIFEIEGKKFNLAAAQALGFEDDSVVLNPALDKDYLPTSESPVYKLGFRKII